MIQTPTFWLLLLFSALIYWLLPLKFRDGFLAIASYAYLASLEPVVVTVLIVWVLFFFYLTPHAIIAKRINRLVIPGLILAILSYFIYYKYNYQLSRFFPALALSGNSAVPLGISYLYLNLFIMP